MLLAIDSSGHLRAPEATGERGTCPGCGSRVDSAVGELVIHHWRHFGRPDCDPWAGGETDWHLQWKTAALKVGYRVEVPFAGPPLHRADAVSRRGHVVEFQHSGLRPEEMDERSEFYSRFGPITWVFDGSVPAWRKRWHRWRRDESEPPEGMLVIDEGERLWAMSSEELQPASVTSAGVLSAQIEIRSMELWSRETPCATCGSMPTHAYPDGSPGYRFCLHAPVYESETYA
jgi:hypothetical protein